MDVGQYFKVTQRATMQSGPQSVLHFEQCIFHFVVQRFRCGISHLPLTAYVPLISGALLFGLTLPVAKFVFCSVCGLLSSLFRSLGEKSIKNSFFCPQRWFLWSILLYQVSTVCNVLYGLWNLLCDSLQTLWRERRKIINPGAATRDNTG